MCVHIHLIIRNDPFFLCKEQPLQCLGLYISEPVFIIQISQIHSISTILDYQYSSVKLMIYKIQS